MSDASHDVFISYSSKDKATADAVCALLERDGVKCWIAPRDITVGQEWAGSIVDAISAAKVFILLFSEASNASAQVRREVERAAHNELPILPFRLDNVAPSPTLEFFLSTPHWLDAFGPPLERHIARLSAATRRLLASDAPITASRPVDHATAREHVVQARAVPRRRTWRIAVGTAAGLGVLIAVLAAGRLLSQSAEQQASAAATKKTLDMLWGKYAVRGESCDASTFHIRAFAEASPGVSTINIEAAQSLPSTARVTSVQGADVTAQGSPASGGGEIAWDFRLNPDTTVSISNALGEQITLIRCPESWS